MVRVALACALALLGASADDLNSEHMGLLQAKNRGQVGVHTHTGDAPVITFDASECTLWGYVCPHKAYNDMEAAAEAEKKLLAESIASTITEIENLQTEIDTVRASTQDLGQKKEALADCTLKAQAAAEKLRQDMGTSLAQFTELSASLEQQIDALESRLSTAIEGVLNIVEALAGGSADDASLLQTNGPLDYLKRKAREAAEAIKAAADRAAKATAKAACDAADEYAGHKCTRRIVERQAEHQQALNDLDAGLTGLEDSLKQEGDVLQSSLTDEAAAQTAFDEAEKTNANAKAMVKKLKEDQESQQASQAEDLAELKKSLSELEGIAASFSQGLANTLLFE